MTWSYNLALTASKDQVRLLIQDTNTARQLLADEEITFFLGAEANAYMAAARCCEVLIARAGNVKAKRVGDTSLDYDVSFYKGLALSLRQRGQTYQTLYAGGQTMTDKSADQNDTDLVQPDFARGMDEHPGTSGKPTVLSPEQL